MTCSGGESSRKGLDLAHNVGIRLMVDVASWLPRNSLVGVGGSVDVSIGDNKCLVGP